MYLLINALTWKTQK